MRRWPLALLLCAAAPGEVAAHVAVQEAGAFVSGFAHPLVEPAHLLNLLALGLLVGQSEARRRLKVLIFCLCVLCGLAATARIYTSPVTLILPASAGVLGILVAGAWRLPQLLTVLAAAVIGVMIGLDSRPETPFLRDALLMFAGTTLGAGLIVSAVSFCAWTFDRPWQRIGARVIGSWIAAIAILVTALLLVR